MLNATGKSIVNSGKKIVQLFFSKTHPWLLGDGGIQEFVRRQGLGESALAVGQPS